MDLSLYIGQTISKICFWLPCGLKSEIESQKYHSDIQTVEVCFLNGEKLILDGGSSDPGLLFGSKEIDWAWDNEMEKIDVSSHSIYKQLIGQQVAHIELWQAKSQLFQEGGPPKEAESYLQEVVIRTECEGYFMCSSA